MAEVPEKVLTWLFSVLHEYRDVQRTYSDAAHTLSVFSTLSPRTEVYTYDGGTSALLLTISGTLPVDFRGTTYRFPFKLWIPQAYPQDAPVVYVVPGKDMVIRPGQHVGVDGRVYHPYLRDWNKMWDRASIAGCLDFVQQVFAKEPPVISRIQQQQYHQRPVVSQQSPAANGPAPPQLPPKQNLSNVVPIEMPTINTPIPPPKPPKPGDGVHQQRPLSTRDVPRDGPPLPPLPHEGSRSQQSAPSRHTNGYGQPSWNDRAFEPPPSSPQPRQLPPPDRCIYGRSRSPVSPVSPVARLHGHPQSHTAPLTPQQQFMGNESRLNQYPGVSHAMPHAQLQAFHPDRTRQFSPHQYRQMPLPRPQPSKQPAIDLLSDPFDITMPGPSSSGLSVSAPPIPPNPEKEHLLHALSTALVQQAQMKVSQNLSRLAPLQAQQMALHSAQTRLELEIRQLEHLARALDSNEAILHRSVHDCEITIKSAKSKPQPPIDDVLVAPTLVAQQLWTLSAEEAGCREAMYVLQKAVDRGRMSGEVFVRQMRGLGRECFLKMVLARKCARGLGLEMQGR